MFAIFGKNSAMKYVFQVSVDRYEALRYEGFLENIAIGYLKTLLSPNGTKKNMSTLFTHFSKTILCGKGNLKQRSLNLAAGK